MFKRFMKKFLKPTNQDLHTVLNKYLIAVREKINKVQIIKLYVRLYGFSKQFFIYNFIHAVHFVFGFLVENFPHLIVN